MYLKLVTNDEKYSERETKRRIDAVMANELNDLSRLSTLARKHSPKGGRGALGLKTISCPSRRRRRRYTHKMRKC